MAKEYCLCRKPYEPNEFMIECEICKEWFHGRCVGILEHQSTDIEIYHCPKCQISHGPLKLKKRKSSLRFDTSESDNSAGKITQTGTVSFVHELKRRTFPSADLIPVIHLSGHQVRKEYFEQNGFDVPILVDNRDGLDLKVPPSNFTIQDVENHVGSMREIDVIDVAHQEDCKMLMREWTEYYNSPDRRKIFNVISLEFSNTSLASLVSPPRVVSELSWVNKYWQMALSVVGPPLQKPEVHRYCLMGVKDSFTDFHIDFGGTSVWYHILRGEKIFYLVRPTAANMALYERWLSSSKQSEMFFGDQVDACYKCLIKQGQTLFIPTGWIHAVLTPIDSLVFGGNFLHDFSIDLQLKIYEIERRVKTQEKYMFPSFETLHWYAAKVIFDAISGRLKTGLSVPQYLSNGAKALFTALKSWTHKKDPVRQSMIPITIQYTKLLKDLQKLVKDLNLCTKGKVTTDKNFITSSPPPPVHSDVKKSGSFTEKSKGKRLSDSNSSPHGKKKLTKKKLQSDFRESSVGEVPQKTGFSALEPAKPVSASSEFALNEFSVDSFKHDVDRTFAPNYSSSKFDSRMQSPNLFPVKSENLDFTASGKLDENVVLKLRMVGGKVVGEGDGKESVLSSPSQNSGIGFRLLGDNTTLISKNKHLTQSAASDDDEMLVVDETPTKSKASAVNTASTTIKPASLKLKLSVTKPVVHPEATWSTTTLSSPSNSFPRLAGSDSNPVNSPVDFAHRLAMPVIRGGLNSSISDILEVGGYGTETDIKIDDDIRRASPTMRDAIQGMLSMSQMGRTSSLTSNSTLLSSATKGRLGQGKMSKYDDFELDMPTCYKDDEFVYPTLDISDTEDSLKSRTNAKQDEAWNPKGAKILSNRPKPDRPKREGARKEAVESGLAAAAAKFLNHPTPKRQYNRKKPKLEKKSFVSPEPLPSTSVPSTSTPPSASAVSPTSLSAGAAGKKPKKGMATAKQRLAQKLKIHKMLY